MKILLSGKYNLSFFRAFKKIIDDVEIFDDEGLYKKQLAFLKNKYTHRLFWKFFSIFVQNEFLKIAKERKPDLIIIFKGWFFSPQLLSELKKELPKSALFCFNPDNPFNIQHFGSSNRWIISSIPSYDVYFIWTMSLRERLEKSGSKQVEFLPFAYDPDLHYPVQVSPEEAIDYGSDLVFIGNWDKKRENWLKELADFDLAIWGEDYWGKRCKDKILRRRWQRKAMYGEDMSLVLSASKISLNILRKQNEGACNMRTFEAPACGAFVLSERSLEAKGFFEEDKEAVYFSSPEELRDKAQYYLRHEEERKRIAQAGYQRCLKSDYSYFCLARQILDVYWGIISKPKKKYKLAILATHVIQNCAPLYQQINAHPDIELTLFLCSHYGLRSMMDPGFGVKFKWDTVNLDGLNYKFLKNYSPFSNINKFYGLMNLGIIKELKIDKFDAVIVSGYYLIIFWLTFYACYLTKTPLVLTGEPPSPWTLKKELLIRRITKKILISRLLNKVSAILYVGKKSREYYLNLRTDIQDKLFFCPFSVDNNFFLEKAREFQGRKDQIKKELGIPLGYPTILFLSKITRWKRPMFLLNLFQQLKTPANLVYVGSGYRLDALKKYVIQRGLERVFFFGFQNYSQVPKFYSISDIFILPSLGESWGLVINEAMCFGLPIITTDKVMAAYDLLRDGENGYIINPDDVKSFVEALEYLLSHPQERERMGKVSLEIIKEWNYSRYIEGLLAALSFIHSQQENRAFKGKARMNKSCSVSTITGLGF